MRYTYDHDLHIHSILSSCSRHPGQTPAHLLDYAKRHGLHTIAVTDHFWDETVDGASPWYVPQNFSHISRSLPLPEAEGVRFLFGCETEMNRYNTIGVSRERMEAFDFIIVPTTHFHMKDYSLFEPQAARPETRAAAWIDRLDILLSRDLPFARMGIAHLACGLICRERTGYLNTLRALPEAELYRVFSRAAKKGVGIELNRDDMSCPPSEEELVFRPFRIAKACGCKFYLGSDAHKPEALEACGPAFERAIDLLELTEEDKFIPRRS